MGAGIDDGLGEFVLSYTAVRTAHDSQATLLNFLQRTDEAAAAWDRSIWSEAGTT